MSLKPAEPFIRGPYKGMTIAERFWSHVEKTRGCWLWTGFVLAVGKIRYGRFSPFCRRMAGDGVVVHYAHRVAWELTNGPIPKGMEVTHSDTCKDRTCVNPAHLHLATPREARARGAEKRRGRVRVRMMTEAKVRRVRKEYAAGATYIELAEKYKCSCMNIAAIVKRRSWQHVA